MSTYESPTVSEERAATEIVARHSPAEGVNSIAVEFGTDYSDTSAMWLVFSLDRDAEELQDTYSSVYDFADEIRADLRDAGIERFAFARFGRTSSDPQK